MENKEKCLICGKLCLGEHYYNSVSKKYLMRYNCKNPDCENNLFKYKNVEVKLR